MTAHHVIVALEVVNSGNKAAGSFHCEVYLPNKLYQQVAITEDGIRAEPQSLANTLLVNGVLFDRYDVVVTEPLFPWGKATPVTLRLRKELERFPIGWRVRYEDGVQPESPYDAPTLNIYECVYDPDYGNLYGGYHLIPRAEVREAGYEEPLKPLYHWRRWVQMAKPIFRRSPST